jgi:uncharacterized membrane protein
MRWENVVTIGAPAEVVWRLTADVERWPEYTPTMRKVQRLDDGPLRVGSTARVEQPAQTPAVWTVSTLDEGRVFAWQTRRMGLTLTGSHTIEAIDGAQCRNILALDVSGRGARLFGLIFGALFSRSLARENAGFRTRAENS